MRKNTDDMFPFIMMLMILLWVIISVALAPVRAMPYINEIGDDYIILDFDGELHEFDKPSDVKEDSRFVVGHWLAYESKTPENFTIDYTR